jgi:hypothetical protein
MVQMLHHLGSSGSLEVAIPNSSSVLSKSMSSLFVGKVGLMQPIFAARSPKRHSRRRAGHLRQTIRWKPTAWYAVRSKSMRLGASQEESRIERGRRLGVQSPPRVAALAHCAVRKLSDKPKQRPAARPFLSCYLKAANVTKNSIPGPRSRWKMEEAHWGSHRYTASATCQMLHMSAGCEQRMAAITEQSPDTE